MDIKISENTKIVILEGVPGSGKNTLHEKIKKESVGRKVYSFEEESMLFSWKHGWIPGIDSMRLVFYENFLSYCEEVIAKDNSALFIVERFHISYRLYTKLNSEQHESRYQDILKKLKKLSAVVVVPLLGVEDIESRSVHVERLDPIWRQHLERRLKQEGFSSVTDMYAAQQESIKSLLKEQAIPFILSDSSLEV